MPATLREIGGRWKTVFLVDWLVWPPYFAVAFAFVPEELRPATAAFFNALWGVFISFMSAAA